MKKKRKKIFTNILNSYFEIFMLKKNKSEIFLTKRQKKKENFLLHKKLSWIFFKLKVDTNY